MSDLISRRLVIDAICDNCDTVEASCPHYPCGRYMAVEKLPSAQPEPQWIPVSEGLPEYMESVLTWDGVTYCVEKRIRCIRDEEGDPIEGDWWVSDEYDDIESDYYPDLRDGAAIAWMPLPEPYRAERRTDELRSENSR